jgi:hypothetical protein
MVFERETVQPQTRHNPEAYWELKKLFLKKQISILIS